MTKTMIPPDPQSGDDRPNRWFQSGQLVPSIEPAQPVAPLPQLGPQLLPASPSSVPLPKRAGKPAGRHRAAEQNGVPSNASLTQPTPADLAQVVEIVDELQGMFSRAAAGRLDSALVSRSAAVDDVVRPELAAAAAHRVAKGHLTYTAREALAAVLTAYAGLSTSVVLPVALLATMENAVAVLAASPADQQLGAETDGPATSTTPGGAL